MATAKQIKAFKKTLGNIGSKEPETMKQILIDAGYSPTVADTPTLITNSKGWNELVEENLPDSLLTKVHMEGLSATRGEEAEPDYPTRHKYLETAYKIKKKMTDAPTNNNVVVNILKYGGDNSTPPLSS